MLSDSHSGLVRQVGFEYGGEADRVRPAGQRGVAPSAARRVTTGQSVAGKYEVRVRPIRINETQTRVV